MSLAQPAPPTALRSQPWWQNVGYFEGTGSMALPVTIDASAIEPGTYLLPVEFVANDHAPFNLRVMVARRIEVGVPPSG